MIRVVWFFVFVGLLAAGTAWLADRPGDLVLDWMGYRIEISLMTAAAILLIVIGGSVFLWSTLAGIIASPGILSGIIRSRRQEKGYSALSQGIIAVSAGDARAAAKFSAQASKVLGDQPLSLLLKAQTAQLRGDRAGARRAFEIMLKSPETQNLGLRGLYIESRRQNDPEASMAYARRALSDNRATEWAATALFDMQSASGDWSQALDTLATNLHHNLIDKSRARRWRAVLLTGQAMRLQDTDPDAALQLALEAHGLAEDLVPAAVIAGRLLGHQGNMRRATRILEQAWLRSPHPDIAGAYADVRPGDSVRDRLQRVSDLAATTVNNPVGAMAVAETAIDSLDWGAARNALLPHLEDRPSQLICELMAEIEEGEHGDRGRAREWLSRAVRAPRDPAWTADGIVSPIWAPISPVTGRIDAFEWKTPIERIGGPESEEYDEDILTASPIEDTEPVDIVAEPAENLGEERNPDEETESSAKGDSAAHHDGQIRDKSDKTEHGDPAKNPGKARNTEIPVAPDDPGPDAAAMLDEDASYREPG